MRKFAALDYPVLPFDMEIAFECTNHQCPLRALCATYMDNAGPSPTVAYRRFAPSTHGNVVTCEQYVSVAAAWRGKALPKAP